MRTVAIVNQKGGCGKTTSAINLSAVLARAGKRVLLIDMDPQGHCAAGLGVPEARIESDVGDAMLSVGQRPIDASKLLWRAGRNLDLCPSRMKLAGLEAARGGFAELPDKERRLSQLLDKFSQEYDVAVIDCPPSIGLLTYNALAAADMVMIPVETAYFALQGATRQVSTVRTLSRRLGSNIATWILPTMHDAKNPVSTDLLEELSRRFTDKVIPVVVRHDPRLREAVSFGQTILDYQPGSMGAEDYGRLGVWTLENLRARTWSAPEQIDTPIVEAAAGIGGAPQPVPARPTPTPAATQANEVKPASRAEDVARRAQELLRRIALGKGPGPGAGWSQVESPAQAATAVVDAVGTVPAQSPAAVALQPLPSGAASRHVLRVVEEPAVEARPINPATQRLLGVRETSQGLLFVQPLALGNAVAIAGSFNGWSATAHVMRRNEALGVFELCLRVPKGKLQYRLVVDGRWMNDPHNPNTEPNPFGEHNSVANFGKDAA